MPDPVGMLGELNVPEISRQFQGAINTFHSKKYELMLEHLNAAIGYLGDETIPLK